MADLRPSISLICVISGKLCQIARPLYTIKQNMRFQVGKCSDKFQPNQIQIIFYMPDIWQTKIQNEPFWGEIYTLKMFKLGKLKMPD